MYVLNNPLILKDPTGLLLPLAVASPIVGAVVGVTVHILTTSDITFGSKSTKLSLTVLILLLFYGYN